MSKRMIGRILDFVGSGIVIVFIVLILPLTVPKLFGYEIYGILSESMEPEIMTGSVVYVKEVAPESVQVNDIITYKMDAKSSVVATHRVVDVDLEKQTYTTKGDNNATVDALPIGFNRLLGKTVLSIPMLGYFSMFLHSATGISLVIIGFAFSIFCWIFADILKKK